MFALPPNNPRSPPTLPLPSQSLCISEPWKMSKREEKERGMVRASPFPLGVEIII